MKGYFSHTLRNATALPPCPSCTVTHSSNPGETQEHTPSKDAFTTQILPYEQLHSPSSLQKGSDLQTVWSHESVCIPLISIIMCSLRAGEAAATLMNHLVNKLSIFRRLYNELV